MALLTFGYLFKSESNEKKLLTKYLQEKELVIIDIGSNHGNYFSKIEKIFKDKKLTIYSIEPNEVLLNKQKSNRSKLLKFNFAASNKNEKVKFNISKISSNSHIENNRTTRFGSIVQTIEVDAVNISDFIKINNIETIDIMKIDTEGQEFIIVESLKNILEKKIIKIIKIELAINFSSRVGTEEYLKILNILSELKYKFIGISNITFKNEILWFFDGYFVLEDLV